MKKIIFLLCLMAGIQGAFAQGVPQYPLIFSNPAVDSYVVQFEEAPFAKWTNVAVGVFHHADFPGMPQQGFISDVFVKLSFLTPAGRTICGLQVRMGKAPFNYMPHDTIGKVFHPEIFLINSVLPNLSQVFYDSLFTLKTNIGPGGWMKIPLQTPYLYSMKPLPNDTPQNLLVELSRKWDGRYYIYMQGEFNLVWYYSKDLTHIGYIKFFKDSMGNIFDSSANVLPEKGTFIIGFNGYSLSVNDPNKMKPFTVFPNPAQSTLHYNEQPSGLFSVYDMAGKQVLQGNTDSNGEIDIKPLPTGAYLLKIGEQTIRFLKE